MRLVDVVSALDQISPPSFAADWDNVGLLVEPASATRLKTVLLTIDLTPRVLREAEQCKAGLVVAYHPPLFSTVRRVTSESAEGRLIRRALQKSIAIYSPHTALDAVTGGVNDWLCEAFGAGKARSLQPHLDVDANQRLKLVTFLPETHVAPLRDALSAAGVAGIIGEYSRCSYELRGQGTFEGSDATKPAVGEAGRFERVEEVRLEMVCREGRELQRVHELLMEFHPYETPAWELYRLEPKPRHDVGQGRLLELRRPLTLRTAVAKIKHHLGLSQLRVAASDSPDGRTTIRSVAVCAGAGGSVLAGVNADLYLTGEMRHHDILAATASGTSVVVTDHTNTERGYLPVYRNRLREVLEGVQVIISQCDADPLRIV